MIYPFGPAPKGIDVLWRLESKRYSICLDPEVELYGTSSPRLEMQWWRVSKRTPKGAQLEIGKFVLLTALKKWACNTEDEAIESFKARKKKQIKILTAQLNAAKADLQLTEPNQDLFNAQPRP